MKLAKINFITRYILCYTKFGLKQKAEDEIKVAFGIKDVIFTKPENTELLKYHCALRIWIKQITTEDILSNKIFTQRFKILCQLYTCYLITATESVKLASMLQFVHLITSSEFDFEGILTIATAAIDENDSNAIASERQDILLLVLHFLSVYRRSSNHKSLFDVFSRRHANRQRNDRDFEDCFFNGI